MAVDGEEALRGATGPGAVAKIEAEAEVTAMGASMEAPGTGAGTVTEAPGTGTAVVERRQRQQGLRWWRQRRRRWKRR